MHALSSQPSRAQHCVTDQLDLRLCRRDFPERLAAIGSGKDDASGSCQDHTTILRPASRLEVECWMAVKCSTIVVNK